MNDYVKMGKFEKQAITRYLFIKGMSAKEIYDNILVTLEDTSF